MANNAVTPTIAGPQGLSGPNVQQSTLTGNVSLATGFSIVVCGPYLIPNGFQITIANGAHLRIIS